MLSTILYSSLSKIRDFDEHGYLRDATASLTFDANFKSELNKQGVQLENSIVHFYQDSCFCHFLATPHIKSVESLVSKHSMTVHKINVGQLNSLTKFVPATPAIAVFNKSGNLAYFGPYSSGMYCTQTNSIVDKFIPTSSELLGATIYTEAKGCYCKSR